MNEEFQQFLKIFKDEQELNAHRFSDLESRLKNEIHKVLKIVLSEQELNSHRYHELKSELTDINLILPTLATKGQLNQVYESLSQDMTYFSGGHMKLKKRVDVLEKKVKRLEDRNS